MSFRKIFVWTVRKLRLLEIWYEDIRGLDFVRRDMSVKGNGNNGYEESPFYARIFNSFDEKIMKPFLQNIKSSVQRVPRKIHIIYYNPLQHNIFIS